MALTASVPPSRGLFDLQGRAAPGIYAAAWALLLVGLGTLVVGLAAASGRGPAGVVFVAASTGILGLAFLAAAGAQGLQRRADGAPFGGPSPFMVFPAVALLSIFATAAISAAFRATGFTPSNQLALFLTVLVNAGVAFGVVGIAVVGTGAMSWREIGFRRPRRGEGSVVEDIGWGLALAVPAFGAAVVLAVVLTAVLGVRGDDIVSLTTEPLGLILNVTAAAALAPLWEEMFFRGYATQAWSKSLAVRATLLRGMLFFSLIHVLGVAGGEFGEAVRLALLAFIVRLPVGYLLGWVMLRRRTLIAPLFLHGAYNAIPLVLYLAGSRALGT